MGKTIDSRITDLAEALASPATQRTMKKSEDKPADLKEIYRRIVFDDDGHAAKLGREATKLSTLAEAMQVALSKNIAKVLIFFDKCNTYLPKDKVYLLDMCIVTEGKMDYRRGYDLHFNREMEKLDHNFKKGTTTFLTEESRKTGGAAEEGAMDTA